MTVVGHAAVIAAGEWITASGDWVNDRTDGQQFRRRTALQFHRVLHDLETHSRARKHQAEADLGADHAKDYTRFFIRTRQGA